MKFKIQNLLYFAFLFSLIQNAENLCEEISTLLEKKLNNINQTKISPQCKEQFSKFLNGLESASEWALKMLDSGLFPLNYGNKFGVYDECLDVLQYFDKFNITGQYCIGTLFARNSNYESFYSLQNQSTQSRSTQVSTCIPNQCSSNDIQRFYSTLGLNVTIDGNSCQTRETNCTWTWTPTIIIATVVYAAVVLGVLSCTIYDSFDCFEHKKDSLYSKLSIKTNFRKLSATQNKTKSNQLLSIHGMRALSMLGIIIYHVEHNLITLRIQNAWYIKQWETSIFGAIVLGSGNPAVHTFFLLSGFLIGYTYIKSLGKHEKFNLWKYYLRRYLRLTPPYAAIVLFYVSFSNCLGNGPYWSSVVTIPDVVACYKQWWKALLYVQNIEPSVYPCVTQSWYLTIDMQLYVLSPILLLVLKKFPHHFMMVIKLVLLVCFMYNIFVVFYYNPSIDLSVTNSPELTAITSQYYYESLVINAIPWLVGFGLSKIMTNVEQNSLRLAKVTVFLFWVFSVLLTIAGWVIHSIVIASDRNDTFLKDIYMTLFSICWSFIVAWMVVACTFNYAGFINSFLSLPIFQLISKLSFSMYLTHLLVIKTVIGQYRDPVVFGNFDILSTFCITVAISLVLATLLTLFVEAPSLVLSDYFLRKRATSSHTLTTCPEKQHLICHNVTMDDKKYTSNI